MKVTQAPSRPSSTVRSALLFASLVGILGAVACENETPEPQSSSARETPPNILLILVDDMGYSDLGAYGSEIATPNIDALAHDGLRFRTFYNTARCWPTRASLLTGLYPHQAGVGGPSDRLDREIVSGPHQGFLNENSATIAEVLRPTGYRTYMVGKWHLGERPEHWPRQRGFDRYFGLISGASSFWEIIADQPRLRQMAHDDERWYPPDDGFYMTDAFTDSAVAFIEGHQARTPEAPFFMYLAYTAPHFPLHAWPDDIAKYEGQYEIGWDSLRAERYARMRDMGVIGERHVLTERPESVPAWVEAGDKDDWARRMQVYAAMMDRLDQGVGKVTEALRRAGHLDNTLILFLSDNGASAERVDGRGLHDPRIPVGARGTYAAVREPWANAQNTPLRRYKQTMFEGGIATPLIAHWPDRIVDLGQFTDDYGHVIDVLPTILDAAGVAYPDSLNGRAITPAPGRSFLPTLLGLESQPRGNLYWEHLGHRAVRHGNWKAVYDRDAGKWLLFDLERDPSESTDLARGEAERLLTMMADWRAWADGVGVHL